MTCPFCCGAGGQIVWQDSLCRVVLADEPDYPGFCRVIANQHIKEMTDLPDTAQIHIIRVVLLVESALRAALQPDKVNLASLGNQVPHLHWHIIPRYYDDKHFPAPIWATPHEQRQPHLQTDATLATLVDTIKTALSAASKTP